MAEEHMDEVEVKEPCLSKCARAMPRPKDIKQRFCEDFKGKNGPMAKGTFVFEYVQVRRRPLERNWIGSDWNRRTLFLSLSLSLSLCLSVSLSLSLSLCLYLPPVYLYFFFFFLFCSAPLSLS